MLLISLYNYKKKFLDFSEQDWEELEEQDQDKYDDVFRLINWIFSLISDSKN